MADLRATFASVRAELSKLNEANPSGFVYITSEDNPDKNSTAGATCEVDNQDAAKHLVARTAHLSSKAEIAAFLERGQKFAAEMAKKELDKNPMAPLIQALAGGVAPMVPPAPVEPAKK